MANHLFEILERSLRANDTSTALRAIAHLSSLDALDSAGRTALMIASEAGALDVVEHLLEAGADPLLSRASTDGLSTALIDAVARRHAAVARRLFEAGLARSNAETRRPMSLSEAGAIFAEDLAELDGALRAGVDPDALVFDAVPLLGFFLGRRNARGSLLVLGWGADTSAVTLEQRPALHEAVRGRMDDVVWLLLVSGEDPNHLWESRSPLFDAAGDGALDIVRDLLDAGADVELGLSTETPLMAAAEQGAKEVVDLLLAHGANPNATTASGWSALHHASWAEHIDLALHLIDRGADRHHRDQRGMNATDHATVRRDPILAQPLRAVGIRDIYSLKDVNDPWQPEGPIDFFISYRHGRFREHAAELARHLKNVDLSTFVDRENLDLAPDAETPIAVLKTRIARAVRHSRCLVFFESYRDNLDDDIALHERIHWQFFELLYAKSALLVSLDAGTVKRWQAVPGRILATSSALFVFDDLAELAERLAANDWTDSKSNPP